MHTARGRSPRVPGTRSDAARTAPGPPRFLATPRSGSRPVKWCTRLSASSSPDVRAARSGRSSARPVSAPGAGWSSARTPGFPLRERLNGPREGPERRARAAPCFALLAAMFVAYAATTTSEGQSCTGETYSGLDLRHAPTSFLWFDRVWEHDDRTLFERAAFRRGHSWSELTTLYRQHPAARHVLRIAASNLLPARQQPVYWSGVFFTMTDRSTVRGSSSCSDADRWPNHDAPG